MRKFFATFTLLAFLSISIFADGETPIGGGRSCPDPIPGEPVVECNVPPSSGNNQTSTTSSETGSTGDEESNGSGLLDDVINYLNSLFG